MAASDSKTEAPPRLVIERVFDAPPEMVWRAWTEPDQVKRWWGPSGFTSPACQIDFRVGGKYLFSMQSPDFNDGKPIWSTGYYREIVPHERIVCTDSFADEDGNIVSGAVYGMPEVPMETIITVTFKDQDGKTLMTLVHEGLPKEHGEGANEGWGQSLDKLAELLS